MKAKSKNYEKIKEYYDKGLWDWTRVHKVVNIGANGITDKEYKEITGEAYSEDNAV